MKRITFIILLPLFAASRLLAQEAPTEPAVEPPPTAEASAPGKPVPDIYPRWSIVGEWRVTHPDWTDTVTFRADGSYAKSRGETGHWLFASDRGELLLVLRWDEAGSEALSMVTPDHFRGQRRKGRYIDMRRDDAAQKPAAEAK